MQVTWETMHWIMFLLLLYDAEQLSMMCHNKLFKKNMREGNRYHGWWCWLSSRTHSSRDTQPAFRNMCTITPRTRPSSSSIQYGWNSLMLRTFFQSSILIDMVAPISTEYHQLYIHSLHFFVEPLDLLPIKCSTLMDHVCIAHVMSHCSLLN